MELPPAGPKHVLVIAGPTGSGESTITNRIIAQYPNSFTRLVTATSRPPRGTETNGVDYYFFTEDEFLEHERAGDMLETTYIPNRGIHYGTYGPDLAAKLASGRIVIVNPDIVGARFYKTRYGATTLFIAPRSIDELRARLQKRNPDMTEQELQHRIENATRELSDERSFYDHVIVNGDGALDAAIEETLRILRGEGYSFD